jgi:aminoglycoside N3'-acetyltransferase
MKLLTKNFIYNHFKQLGIKKGDKILVYSNVSAFGLIDRSFPKKLIGYLLNYIGKEGTLFMPSYSFNQKKNSIFRINKLQKNYSTSFLVKEFFKRKNIKRSYRLIHSHIGIGKYSYLLKNSKNMNSFGKDSDFHLMMKNNFKCVFLGCMPSQAATYFFQLEYLNNVPYRKKIYLERKYYQTGKTKEAIIEYLSNDKLSRYDLNKSFYKLKKVGAKVKEVDLKFGKSFCINLRQFHKYGNKLFKRDINFLVK